MKNTIYIAKYESEALSNNERYYNAIPYNKIGDAINDAINAIMEQQQNNAGFAGYEFHANGEHGVNIIPKYNGTHYDSETKTWTNRAKQGDWRWVKINMVEIK